MIRFVQDREIYITDIPELVEAQSSQFDLVLRGARCTRCGRRQYCPDCPTTKNHMTKTKKGIENEDRI